MRTLCLSRSEVVRMQDVSLYDVLGVDADATPEDIRLAFWGWPIGSIQT